MSSIAQARPWTTVAALDADPAHRRLLYLFTYLAALAAIQILHLALDDLKLNLALTGAVTAAFVYSYYLQPQYRALTTYSVSAASVFLSLYYFLKLRQELVMYGNYLGILLGLLTVLLAFKAFSPGDHRFILMVCVVFLLFSSVASYDLKFMLLLPLFLVFAGIALHIANQIDVAVRVAGTTGEQLGVRFAVDRRFIWILVKAILGIIVFSAVAYTLTPHSAHESRNLVLNSAPRVDEPSTVAAEQQPRAQPQTSSGEAEIGLGEEFDLTDSRRLSSDERAVLKLKSHRSGYLRAQVYDVYTGSSWVKSPLLEAPRGRGLLSLTAGELANQPLIAAYKVPLIDFPSETRARELKVKHDVEVLKGNVFSLNEAEDLSYDINRQEIQLLEAQPPYYFAFYQPYRLENISLTESEQQVDNPLLDSAATLRPVSLDIPHPEKFSYTVYSLVPRVGARQLAQVLSRGPEPLLKRYTQLPLQDSLPAKELKALNIEAEAYRPLSKRLKTFARQFGEDETGQPRSVLQTVDAIQDYLLNSDEFKYTREFKVLDGEQELTEAFLFGTQEGYCRYFASAMAVLCRLNGIAARVVSGYSPGRFKLVENAYVYRADNAHAWVEVYFDGYGWITYDPTPAASASLSSGDLRQALSRTVEFLQELFIVDPAGTQQSIVYALGQLWHFIIEHGLAVSGSTAAALLLGFGVWLLLKRLRRPRRRAFVPENAVIAAYLGTLAELARLGLPRPPSATARRMAELAAAQLPALGEPLRQLAPLYEQAAFAPGSVSPQQAAGATQLARQVAEQVAEELRARRRK